MAIFSPLCALCASTSFTPCMTHPSSCLHCHPQSTQLKHTPACCEASHPSLATEPNAERTLNANILVIVPHIADTRPVTSTSPLFQSAISSPPLPDTHRILRI
jgi:hypothetical protein